MRLRLLTHQILRLGANNADPLLGDEWVIRAIGEAMQNARSPARGSSRVVERAKEYLHAHSPDRVCLDEIAREVGITPVYLTQEFTRCEGIPLYRYQKQLRLTRALADLPECGDITQLAFDLGFNSHSHFTSAFHDAFGLTPSQYRMAIGSEQFGVVAGFKRCARKRQRA